MTPSNLVPDWHVGRSWNDTHLEDGCPCVKERCGLVAVRTADPDCPEHPPERGKSMRQGHPANTCRAYTERREAEAAADASWSHTSGPNP